ncbi:MAG: class I SAM-dependent methyltransferase, partial [Meiothermus silvanus]|nr:class I SAM-dependent methyltransferase [Allomeiothermus silvanus]
AQSALRAAQARYEAYLKAQATYEAQRTAFLQAQRERERLEAEQAQLSQRLAEATQHRQQAEIAEKALRAELNQRVEQESKLSAEARALRAEVERLEAFLQSGADLTEGPRRVKEARLEGIIGVVADLLDVPEGLELAVEVALAARLQWVLTEDDRSAQAAIKLLKQKGGRATFLPLTLLRPAARPRRDWSQEKGVRGLARELVEVRGYPQVGATLFGETLVLESLEAALSLAQANARLNGFAHLEFVRANAFDYLKEAARQGRRFDLIVLDPPAFAKSRAERSGALRGYREINRRAFQLLNPGGILVTCSCSYNLSEADFLEVVRRAAAEGRREARLVEKRGAAQDHPVLLSLPESSYLKCLILAVS